MDPTCRVFFFLLSPHHCSLPRAHSLLYSSPAAPNSTRTAHGGDYLYARTADMDRTRRRGELTSARTADGDEAAGGRWTAHGDKACGER